LTAPGNSFSGATLQNSIVTYANGAYLIGSYRYASSGSADTFIFRSTDGYFWTTNVLGNVITIPLGISLDFFMTGNGFVIAHATAQPPYLLISSDGINWLKTNNVPDNIPQPGFKTAGAGGNGSFVMAGLSALGVYSLPPILTSTDGFT
jgi:hypothetical protein